MDIHNNDYIASPDRNELQRSGRSGFSHVKSFRQHFLALILVLTSALQAAGAFRDNDFPKPLIIGHRGAPGYLDLSQ